MIRGTRCYLSCSVLAAPLLPLDSPCLMGEAAEMGIDLPGSYIGCSSLRCGCSGCGATSFTLLSTP